MQTKHYQDITIYYDQIRIPTGAITTLSTYFILYFLNFQQGVIYDYNSYFYLIVIPIFSII